MLKSIIVSIGLSVLAVSLFVGLCPAMKDHWPADFHPIAFSAMWVVLILFLPAAFLRGRNTTTLGSAVGMSVLMLDEAIASGACSAGMDGFSLVASLALVWWIASFKGTGVCSPWAKATPVIAVLVLANIAMQVFPICLVIHP